MRGIMPLNKGDGLYWAGSDPTVMLSEISSGSKLAGKVLACSSLAF